MNKGDSNELDEIIEKAKDAVQSFSEHDLEKTTQALSDALREVFGENTRSQRFVDVTRIPLICKSIVDTNERLKEIKDRLDTKFVTVEAFTPVRNVVYGLVSLILVAIVGALLAVVIQK